MSNKTDDDFARQDKRERDKLLHSIFTRTAKSIDDILKNTAPADLSASMIQSINTFMKINDISNDTIPDEAEEDREARDLAAQVRKSQQNQERAEAAAVARGEIVSKPTLGNILGKPFDDEDPSNS